MSSPWAFIHALLSHVILALAIGFLVQSETWSVIFQSCIFQILFFCSPVLQFQVL